MKNILLTASSLIISVSLHSPALARPAHDAQAGETTAASSGETVSLTDIRRIKLGMTSNEVLASMRGKPAETMTPQIWVYWDFRGLKRPADMKQPATIVFFTDDRVSLIRYSEAALVRKTLTELRAAAGAVAVAAK